MGLHLYLFTKMTEYWKKKGSSVQSFQLDGIQVSILNAPNNK